MIKIQWLVGSLVWRCLQYTKISMSKVHASEQSNGKWLTIRPDTWTRAAVNWMVVIFNGIIVVPNISTSNLVQLSVFAVHLGCFMYNVSICNGHTHTNNSNNKINTKNKNFSHVICVQMRHFTFASIRQIFAGLTDLLVSL